MDIREKEINNLTSDRTWKDTVVQACICGNSTFYVVASFTEDGEMGGYFTEGMCFDCNAWVRLPTPIDNE